MSDYKNCTVKIYDVTYFLVDENGNEVLNEDGTTKLFKDYEGAADTSTWAEWVEVDDLSEKENI